MRSACGVHGSGGHSRTSRTKTCFNSSGYEPSAILPDAPRATLAPRAEHSVRIALASYLEVARHEPAQRSREFGYMLVLERQCAVKSWRELSRHAAVNTIEHERVEVQIEIQRAAKALSEDDRSRARGERSHTRTAAPCWRRACAKSWPRRPAPRRVILWQRVPAGGSSFRGEAL